MNCMALKTFLSVPAEDSELARFFEVQLDVTIDQFLVLQELPLAPFSAWLPWARDTLAISILLGRSVSLADLLCRVSGAIKTAFEDPLWLRIEISQCRCTAGTCTLQ